MTPNATTQLNIRNVTVNVNVTSVSTKLLLSERTRNSAAWSFWVGVIRWLRWWWSSMDMFVPGFFSVVKVALQQEDSF